MNIYIRTLGCKTNQFESQAMESLLTSRGHTIADTETDCDAVILNTCAVTAESVRKSRQALSHIRAANRDAVIAVCGCWPQLEGNDIPLADIVFGSGNHRELVETLENAVSDKKSGISHAASDSSMDSANVAQSGNVTDPDSSAERHGRVDNAMKRGDFELLPAGSSHSRTRALLKIEDGCLNFCAYCIIPYTRGPVRSMPLPDAVNEASRLQAEGYREIVLTGIEIASYRYDGHTLADVTAAIAEAAPRCRIHLGSLEPRIVDEKFCRALSKYDNICNHFHLSLQSGCDETLRRMRRKYTTERFFESVSLLRDFFPDCGITADLIVGFPGETDAEFETTLKFLEKCGFSYVHVFPYSRRPGTIAERLDGQIEKSVKHKRALIASETASKSRAEFLNRHIGMVLPTLFEQEISDGVWEGHTGNYLTVRAKGENLHNNLANVRITGVSDFKLSGVIIL